jgi:ATP-dependent DNA helicase RecQ
VTEVQTRKVRELYGMLDGIGCRASAIRHYFGETDAEPCGVCDRCLRPPKGVDVTVAAQKALAAVHRLGGRFGRGRVVDHLLGKTKAVSSHEAAMSTFGVGAEFSPAGWRGVMDQLMFEGLLIEQSNEGRPLITLGDPEAVRAVYRGERRVEMATAPQALDGGTRSGNPRKRTQAARDSLGDDAALFESLRAWRKSEASRQGVPPYVIFHDQTLADIARARPLTLYDLAETNGVGQGKLDRYGEAVLAVVAAGLR